MRKNSSNTNNSVTAKRSVVVGSMPSSIVVIWDNYSDGKVRSAYIVRRNSLEHKALIHYARNVSRRHVSEISNTSSNRELFEPYLRSF